MSLPGQHPVPIRGAGILLNMANRDGTPKWGYVETCPWCSAGPTPRVSPQQSTCGREGCSVKAQRETARLNRERKKGKT